MAHSRYVKPSRLATVLNRALEALAHLGISLYGSRLLAVRGRNSGEWRTTPVNVVEHEGVRYLVAPRGETHWVKNLRVAGAGELRLGRRREAFRAREVAHEEKAPILRAYLSRWGFEVRAFFQGVGSAAPDDELRRVAPDYPVFRIESVENIRAEVRPC
jgi:deazaflavin-dependent oxidoreductase (nitroreductase family)